MEIGPGTSARRPQRASFGGPRRARIAPDIDSCGARVVRATYAAPAGAHDGTGGGMTQEPTPTSPDPILDLDAGRAAAPTTGEIPGTEPLFDMPAGQRKPLAHVVLVSGPSAWIRRTHRRNSRAVTHECPCDLR